MAVGFAWMQLDVEVADLNEQVRAVVDGVAMSSSAAWPKLTVRGGVALGRLKEPQERDTVIFYDPQQQSLPWSLALTYVGGTSAGREVREDPQFGDEVILGTPFPFLVSGAGPVGAAASIERTLAEVVASLSTK
jgi:hypothetical protein